MVVESYGELQIPLSVTAGDTITGSYTADLYGSPDGDESDCYFSIGIDGIDGWGVGGHLPYMETEVIVPSTPFSYTFPTTGTHELDLYAETVIYGRGDWPDGNTAEINLSVNLDDVNLPEPATLTLLGTALLGLGVVYLRRRRAKA